MACHGWTILGETRNSTSIRYSQYQGLGPSPPPRPQGTRRRNLTNHRDAWCILLVCETSLQGYSWLLATWCMVIVFGKRYKENANRILRWLAIIRYCMLTDELRTANDDDDDLRMRYKVINLLRMGVRRGGYCFRTHHGSNRRNS